MYPELVGFLGMINNDTGVQGKAFIFKMIDAVSSFECVLFVHSTAMPFVTIDGDGETVSEDYKDWVLHTIFDKYPFKDLLEYEDK